MILFKKAEELTKHLITISQNEIPTGFVPTMGALHKGHLQLVETCRQNSGLCIVSIFVNPTQFNDLTDFKKYPVTIEADIRLLEEAGCDILFLPSVPEIYPDGTSHLHWFDLGHLETIWEGKYRPGHFQGVCQVMQRLLEIVMPTRLFMGSKDYQQCMVIRRLIELNQWNIRLIMAPTVREPSGLAMSSRNTRLNESQREQAAAIFRTMRYIHQHISNKSIADLVTEGTRILSEAGFKTIDYIGIADADTLQPVTQRQEQQSLVVLIAAFIGGVRLIDNMVL
jgi:pantoate--beta-alanine ligase